MCFSGRHFNLLHRKQKLTISAPEVVESSSPHTWRTSMFASAAPSQQPAISPVSSQVSPTSHPRSSRRLRGLSFLRNVNNLHLSLHSQLDSTPSLAPHHALARTTSYQSALPNENSAARPAPSSAPAEWRHTILGVPAGASPSTQPRIESSEPLIQEDTEEFVGEIMARQRSATGTPQGSVRRGQSVPVNSAAPPNRIGRTVSSNAVPTESATTNQRESTGLAGLPQDQMPTIKFIPHQDLRAGKPSLTFVTTSRTLPHEDCMIRVGRYSERDGNPNPPSNIPSSAPVGFKSKVVSRRHCEFWCSQGQWYIKDVRSSSGTFLNHIRLSQPSVESRPFPVNDGDIVQLGIDFRGGEEMIFRCVKIRIEVNRSWQKSLNNFNMTTHKRLLGKTQSKTDSDTASTHSSECSICLMSIAPCQSLFVAPCSHVWHYKCIRPILNDHKTWPQFLCPNCRAVTDLEADVDELNDIQWDELEENAGLGPDGDEILHHTNSNQSQPVDQELMEVLSANAGRLSADNRATMVGPSEQLNPPQRTSLATNLGHCESSSNRNSSSSEDGSLPEQQNTPKATMSAAMLHHEGPLTPRNDAGPFIFDGSAGRSPASRRAVPNLAEVAEIPVTANGYDE